MATHRPPCIEVSYGVVWLWVPTCRQSDSGDLIGIDEEQMMEVVPCALCRSMSLAICLTHQCLCVLVPLEKVADEMRPMMEFPFYR